MWIPSDGLRLFGVLHEPATRARAGIVICAPILHEYVPSHRLFAMLAHELQQRGIAVLRFDYRGTGDSDGDDGSFSIRHAVVDTGKAIDALSARTGGAPLILLGVRAGALIAATLASERTVDQLWLWQPVVDGASYLKGLREFEAEERQSPMRYRMPKSDGPDDAATLMGFACGSGLSAELQDTIWPQAGIDTSAVTLLDASVGERSPAHARHIALAPALTEWAAQLDMARIAVGPIRALAGELAKTVSGA